MEPIFRAENHIHCDSRVQTVHFHDMSSCFSEIKTFVRKLENSKQPHGESDSSGKINMTDARVDRRTHKCLYASSLHIIERLLYRLKFVKFSYFLDHLNSTFDAI